MKKLLVSLVVIFLVVFGIYKFAYKSHRDISSEKADYVMTVKQVKSEYLKSDTLTNKKYNDKTIEIYGKITSVDLEHGAIIIDEKLYISFKDKSNNTLKIFDSIRVKGRFIGFDELLEEFRMDQASVEK